MLFSTALFVRGSVAGKNALFVWDGVIVRTRLENGDRMVTGLWPGSVAEQAGIKVGDLIKDDLFTDYAVLSGDYTVNGIQRKILPASWEPHLNDVIARTVIRDGQPVQIEYTLESSTFAWFLLVVHMVPAFLAAVAAIWLLRRWGPEPGLQIFFPLLLASAFLFLAFALSHMVVYIDSVTSHIVLPSLVIFILMFPDPLRMLERRRFLLWLIYIPLIVPLIEFLTGQGIPPNSRVELQLYSYIGYALAIIAAVFVKWVGRDLKRYPALWVLLIGCLTASFTVIPSTLINTLDLATARSIFGTDTSLRITSISLVGIGSALAILLTSVGYHRLQKQIGPSFVAQLESDPVPTHNL
jgi:hypothetical protein